MKWIDRHWESKPGTLVSLQFTWRDCWKLESAFWLFLLFGRVCKFDVSFSYEQIKRFWLTFSKKKKDCDWFWTVICSLTERRGTLHWHSASWVCRHLAKPSYTLIRIRWITYSLQCYQNNSSTHEAHIPKGWKELTVQRIITEIKTENISSIYAHQRPAETNPCNVTMPITIFWLSMTGKNCTGDGGASIFFMASTAIASGLMVLGFLIYNQKRC